MIKRSFIITGDAWFADTALRNTDIIDEINIMVHENDKLVGEFMIRWRRVGSITPRLEVFADAWKAMMMCDDFLARLGEYNNNFLERCGKYVSPNPTSVFLAGELHDLGFEDVTPHTNPHEDED